MKRKILLAALLLTIVYICFAVWTIRAYNQWASSAIQRAAHGNAALIPYIDVTAYPDTIYGQTAMTGAATVVVIDIIVLALSLRSKAKSVAIN